MRFGLLFITLIWTSFASASKYDGLYWVELIPSSAIGDFNITCVGARGHMEIINNLITGSVVSDQLLNFAVEGEIDEFGSIAGGIALSAGVVASYEGRHRSTSGRGSWKTDNGCTGRWKAKLTVKTVNNKQRVAVYKQLEKTLCNESFTQCLSETTAACANALTSAVESCGTLFKQDLDETQTTQIGQCVTKNWVSNLRVPHSSLAYCIQQRANR